MLSKFEPICSLLAVIALVFLFNCVVLKKLRVSQRYCLTVDKDWFITESRIIGLELMSLLGSCNELFVKVFRFVKLELSFEDKTKSLFKKLTTLSFIENLLVTNKTLLILGLRLGKVGSNLGGK
jgi:hypothetical protein